jgi:ADP-glucose type glycogen/starch synthase
VRPVSRLTAGPGGAGAGRSGEGRGARERLRILYVAAEVAPFAKTGGLADVAGALPHALARLGHDVRVVMPLHRGVEAVAGPLRVAVPRVTVPIGDRTVEGALLEGRLGEGVPVYFVAQDGYYDRPALYGASDDCERFVFFCRSLLVGLADLGWTPQVVHANDWQAGLVPVYLETLYRDMPAYADVATVFTVHNLAYQGVFWHYDLPMTGLGWDLFTPAGIEFYGHLSLLKGGLIFADLLTTVSPTYAREIQTPAFGERMDGVLRERRADLVGILNGLDVLAWNPARTRLPKRYSPDDGGSGRRASTRIRESGGDRARALARSWRSSAGSPTRRDWTWWRPACRRSSRAAGSSSCSARGTIATRASSRSWRRSIRGRWRCDSASTRAWPAGSTRGRTCS